MIKQENLWEPRSHWWIVVDGKTGQIATRSHSYPLCFRTRHHARIMKAEICPGKGSSIKKVKGFFRPL